MVHVEFIYKGSVVDTTQADIPYDLNSLATVHDMIKKGEIKRPENYDRIRVIAELDRSLWRG